jgi:hypothetical protein
MRRLSRVNSSCTFARIRRFGEPIHSPRHRFEGTALYPDEYQKKIEFEHREIREAHVGPK